MYGPVIEGERVRLVPPRAEWAAIYQRWFADMDVTRYLLSRQPPSLRQEEEFLEQAAQDPNRVIWAIALRDGDLVIGAAGIEKIDWRNGDAETGIMIGDKRHWRRGYAGEVMRLRTAYAFRELGLRKLWTGVWLPNQGSRRALENAGYRQCGLLRRHGYVDGAMARHVDGRGAPRGVGAGGGVYGPVIPGERVRLEPPRRESAPTFIRWFADRDVTRYLRVRHPASLKKEEEWLEEMASSPDDVLWAMARAVDGGLIGTIQLMRIVWRHQPRRARLRDRRAGRVGQGARHRGHRARHRLRLPRARRSRRRGRR